MSQGSDSVQHQLLHNVIMAVISGCVSGSIVPHSLSEFGLNVNSDTFFFQCLIILIVCDFNDCYKKCFCACDKALCTSSQQILFLH